MLGVFLNPFVQPSHARGISDGGWFVCSGTPPIALPSNTTAPRQQHPILPAMESGIKQAGHLSSTA
jgi:hypothetical protein